MDAVMLVSFAYSIVNLAVAIFVTFAILRFLDILCGIKFSEWVRDASDMSLAVYFSGRIIAVCVLLGLLLS